MNQRIAGLTTRIHELESELEAEFARRRLELAFTVRGRAAHFELAVLRRHRKLKTSLSRYILGARPLLILTAPVIYALIIPLTLLDLFVTLYQSICFPVFGMPRVRRSTYLVMDRRQYWCPIKHAQRVTGAHERYRKFVDYGDAESYHSELGTLREDLRKGRGGPA